MEKKNIHYYTTKLIDKAERPIKKTIGFLKGNAVYAYWGGGLPNFGDFIPPLLFEYYGLTPIKIEKKFINSAEILTVGSILNWVQEDFSGYILGSGLIFNVKRNFPNAKILAVRGSLTKELIGAPKDVHLGDPGLLIPKFYKKRKKKKYVLGLVPHYEDKNDYRLEKIVDQYPCAVKIVDVQQRPLKVISDIDECEHILSSSLHGLITADTLKIPSAWILLTEKVLGKGFKFFDYSSALNMRIVPNFIKGDESLSGLIKFTRSVSEKINELQYNLNHDFETFAKEIQSE